MGYAQSFVTYYNVFTFCQVNLYIKCIATLGNSMQEGERVREKVEEEKKLFKYVLTESNNGRVKKTRCRK